MKAEKPSTTFQVLVLTIPVLASFGVMMAMTKLAIIEPPVAGLTVLALTTLTLLVVFSARPSGAWAVPILGGLALAAIPVADLLNMEIGDGVKVGLVAAMTAGLGALVGNSLPAAISRFIAAMAVGFTVASFGAWLLMPTALATALILPFAPTFLLVRIMGGVRGGLHNHLEKAIALVGTSLLLLAASAGVVGVSGATHGKEQRPLGNFQPSTRLEEAVVEARRAGPEPSVVVKGVPLEQEVARQPPKPKGVSQENPPSAVQTGQVHEEQTVTLHPSDRGIVLRVVRSSQEATHSMNLLKYAVRRIAEFMGDDEPFVSGQPVTLHFSEGAFSNSPQIAGYRQTSGGRAGVIFVSPKYDDVDGSQEDYWARSIIVHEAAHSYWNGNESWVDEGAASFLEHYLKVKRTGQVPTLYHPPSDYCISISELERLTLRTDEPAFYCNHSLGQRFFLDLYHSLGEPFFRSGFRALYAKAKSVRAGIYDVRAAFKTGATLEQQAAVDRVVARWYDGVGLVGPAQVSESPVSSSLTGVNGKIERVYVGHVPNEPIATFSGLDVEGRARLYFEISLVAPGSQTDQAEAIFEIVYYADFFGYGVEAGRETIAWRPAEHTLNWNIPVKIVPFPSSPTGHYWVGVYEQGHHIAQVRWTVAPESDCEREPEAETNDGMPEG